MRVEFTVDEEDVLAWMRFATRRRRQFQKAQKQVPPLLMLLVAIVGWLAFRNWPGALIGLAAGAAFGWLAFPRIMTGTMDRQLRAALVDPPEGLMGHQIMELTGDGLRKASGAGESVFRYSAIRGIETDGAHAYIMLGPEYAIVAPFTADGEMRGFLEDLERRLPAR